MAAFLWWRLRIIANHGEPWCTLSEMALRAEPGGPNLCVGGTASASSVYSAGWEAGRAFDGDPATSWVSAGGPPQWLAYRCPAPIAPVELVLGFPPTSAGGIRPQQSPRECIVEASHDGNSWQPQASFGGMLPLAYGESRVLPLVAPRPAPVRGIGRVAPGAVVGPARPRSLTLAPLPQLQPAGVSPSRNATGHGFKPGAFAGDGRIVGQVRVEGVPAARRVRLYDRQTGILAGEVWSRFDGQYRFEFLDRSRDYFALAHDHLGQWNAVIADGVKPERP